MAALTGSIAASLGCSSDYPATSATLWPEADRLFHQDVRWIGGDGAYSIDLGNERVLWLFGDSFIALSELGTRDEAWMVRNSLALQTGYDPSRCFMRFYYLHADGMPASFFPEQGRIWHWPAHGIRLDDTLLLFYERVATPPDDPTGFENAGWTATLIGNPDLEPTEWQLEPVTLPQNPFGLQLGEAVVREHDHIYVYATGGSFHQVYLARFSVADAALGRLDRPDWWHEGRYSSSGSPTPVLHIGAPEFSVHYDARLRKFVMVDSQGVGPTTLGYRLAERPEGPWSEPRQFIRPPESFNRSAFNYAGKAHPELWGADLVVTYVPSTYEPSPRELEDLYYYPRFVRLNFE